MPCADRIVKRAKKINCNFKAKTVDRSRRAGGSVVSNSNLKTRLMIAVAANSTEENVALRQLCS